MTARAAASRAAPRDAFRWTIGGSGFIGGHCILQLLAAGHRMRMTVRNLAREPEVRTLLKRGGVDVGAVAVFRAADLMADAGWAQAVEGHYVLHVAPPFPVGVPKHEDELIIPAREGALRLAESRARGRRKAICAHVLFSGDRLRPSPQAAPFDETTWTDLAGEGVPAYPKSKTLAERAAWDFITAEGDGLELTVVNPVSRVRSCARPR